MPSGAAGLSSTMARLMSIRNRDTAYSSLFHSASLEGDLIDLLSPLSSWTPLAFYLCLFFFVFPSLFLSSVGLFILLFSPCWCVQFILRWTNVSFFVCLGVEPFLSLSTSGSSYPAWRGSAHSTAVLGRRCAAVNLLQQTTPSAGMGRKWQTGKSCVPFCLNLKRALSAPSDKHTP